MNFVNSSKKKKKKERKKKVGYKVALNNTRLKKNSTEVWVHKKYVF